ncbi:hypothetical protein PanWU01x14_169070 [Parasponia andersonii]|uniref:Uncharacterized protein n=1 Tax=Parasponia andersonii TaxID=3476 RepID=A0A2P5CAS6_PARAD|nr:hypothetical protein PanWU01x14_169070 [Parasponia andersonii]
MKPRHHQNQSRRPQKPHQQESHGLWSLGSRTMVKSSNEEKMAVGNDFGNNKPRNLCRSILFLTAFHLEGEDGNGVVDMEEGFGLSLPRAKPLESLQYGDGVSFLTRSTILYTRPNAKDSN